MYYLLILAVGIERLIELVVAKRNARWAFSQGGKEFGHNHYPVMVTLHTALLLGCVLEVWGLHRPFIGWLGWPMLAVAAASQVLRWWCVTTLGRRWNTLVIVVPNAPLVRRGPYRFLHHPNYVAVVASGAHGMVDSHRFHVGELAAAEGADQDRERGTGLYARHAGDDAEHRDQKRRR
jgi:methyltransferase